MDSSKIEYDYSRETILLDNKLKDYPQALNFFLDHEYTHHRINKTSNNILHRFLLNLRLEWETDLRLAFDNSEELEQVRQYKYNVLDAEYSFSEFFVKSIRSFWSPFLYGISKT